VLENKYVVKKVPPTPYYIFASIHKDENGCLPRYRIGKRVDAIGTDAEEAFGFSISQKVYRNILGKNGGITEGLITYFTSYKDSINAAKDLWYRCRYCVYLETVKRGQHITVAFTTKTRKAFFTQLYAALDKYPKAKVTATLEEGAEVEFLLTKRTLNNLKKRYYED